MFRRRPRPATPGSALALFALLAAGCGSGTSTVTGVVTYQGKPVPSGSVIFYCADKQMFHGILDGDGRYTIPDVPRGPAVVTVQTHPRTPYVLQKQMPLPRSINGPVMPTGPAAGRGQLVSIPPRYAHPEESGLTVVIGPSRLTQDIELTP